MSFWSTAGRGFFICWVSWLLTGCQPLGTSSLDEEKDPNYLAGRNRATIGDYRGAVAAYEKAVAANPRSASAHKAMGLVYYQQLSDHAAAIYHFQKLLELNPKDPHADIIRQHIGACKQELASTASLGPVNPRVQRELEKLAAENLRLTADNTNLLHQIAALRQQLSAARQMVQTNYPAPVAAAPVTDLPASKVLIAPSPSPQPVRTPTARTTATGMRATPLPSSPRTHTVRPGDTFMAIARKYRVSVNALTAANPGVNPRKLQIGQILKVP